MNGIQRLPFSMGMSCNGGQCECHRHHNNNHNCNGLNTNPGTNVDPGNAVLQFLNEYYKNTTLTGWNASLYLFDHNCMVVCKDKHIGNAHDMLNAFSSEYVKKANYDHVRCKWFVLNNTTLLINVFGQIQFVGFSGNVSSIVTFSETFILSLNTSNGVIKCTHHLFDW